MPRHFQVVFVLGGPGSGKGTQVGVLMRNEANCFFFIQDNLNILLPF